MRSKIHLSRGRSNLLHLALAAGFCCGLVSAQDNASTPPRSDDMVYQSLMAKAVRAAANRHLESVVSVEIIGAVGQASGEVAQDAPTSGVIVDEEGFVLASNIVIRRPSATILVVLPDGTRHAAKVVSRDNHRNLVLLKIKTDKTLTSLSLPDSMTTKIGATTIAVGRYGQDVSPLVSRGVLSAVDRLDGIALQTDARVSPSFYGGPLIDLRGNLLGILIPGVAQGGAADDTGWYDSGIAFAIPAFVIKKKIDRLKNGEDISKGLIGVVPKTRDPLEKGTELAAIRTRSPAEMAGLKPGDKITKLDGQDVERFQQIKQVLGRFDAGETLSVQYDRGGKKQTVEIELVDTIPPLQPQRLGLLLAQVTDEKEATDDDDDSEPTEQILIQSIIPDGPADGKLKTGDILVSINGAAVKDIQSARRMMVSAEAEKAIPIVIRRENNEQNVSISPASISGTMESDWPKIWEDQTEKEWKIESLKLPDINNEAAIIGPPEGEETDSLGLVVALVNPGQGEPKKVLESWSNIARQYGVVVCAVAPSGDQRWSPKEVDTVTRFAKSALKKWPITEAAVSVVAPGSIKGEKAGAADSMAMAVAISASETFFGVAISNEARPPAVRLRENEADSSLQILLPIDSKNDLPTWGTALEKAGYPIVLGGGVGQEEILKWTRLLQAI